MDAKNDAPIAKPDSTSDNIYSSLTRSGHPFTAAEAGDMLNRTASWVRYTAGLHGIGRKFGARSWQFAAEDIMLLAGKRRPPAMKRRIAIKVQAPSQDVVEQFKGVMFVYREKIFQLVHDVSLGLQNRLSDIEGRQDKRIHDIEEQLRVIKLKLEGEDGRGRGVSILGRTAPSTLNTYEAAAA
jgi:hypothetical protein